VSGAHSLLGRQSGLIIQRANKPAQVARDGRGHFIRHVTHHSGNFRSLLSMASKTREEAVNNAREAIVACVEVRAERCMPLSIETSQVEVTV